MATSFQLAMALPELPSPFVVRLVRGRQAVMAAQPLLAAFAEACGQPEAAADLTYFLAKPGILQRTPVLVLIYRRSHAEREALALEGLAGTLLLFEYRFLGVPTRLFTSNDRSGRTTLIAPPELRARVVAFATERLLERRAHLIMLSFRDSPQGTPCTDLLPENSKRLRWAVRTRQFPEFLLLKKSLDETLAPVRSRTRNNMRYFRQRAEAELGCTFHSKVEMSTSELLEFNRECIDALPERAAAWRLRTLKKLRQPVLMGIRDREGRWLSLLAARRLGTSSEVLWQMSRDGYAHISLAQVLRSYFLEHEIARGAERFYVEGGCADPMRLFFEPCDLTDVAILRKSPRAVLAKVLARLLIREENDLATMLIDRTVRWQSSASTAGGSAADTAQGLEPLHATVGSGADRHA